MYRFFHRNVTGRQAEERMLSVTSLPGTFLVRESQSKANCFVLSVVVNKQDIRVLHVTINFQVVSHTIPFYTFTVLWLTPTSQIAHLDMHHLVFGINFQIHFISLVSLVSIHLLIYFSTYPSHHPRSQHPSLLHSFTSD